MTSAPQCPPGLTVRGFVPPRSMGDFKLLIFGMDSALLYPGAEELVAACKAAGMEVELAIGELSDGEAKLQRLHACCADLKIESAQALVVGSAPSDLPMMRTAGLSASYRATPAIAEQAMVAIHTGGMDQLLQVLTLPTMQAAPGLDLSVLDALVGFDAAKFRKFALLFISSVESVLAEVDSAIAQQDLATLMAMGHRAKSTALNIGAAEFSTQCLRLEQAARAQDTPTALAIAGSLRPQFETICNAITQRLESQGTA